MSNKDFIKIVKLAKDAVENPITTFPDFAIENGFIEHFEITSGKTSKNGYDNQRKSAAAVQENIKKINNIPLEEDEAKLVTVSSIYERNNEDVKNLRISFVETWLKHMESYEKYSGDKTISIFMIESDDVLRVYENKKHTGLCFGDVDNRFNDDYCLIYDDELLNFIYDYHNEIHYVIFVGKNGRQLEVIKTENIPAIKEYLRFRSFNIVCPYGYNKYLCTTSAIISK